VDDYLRVPPGEPIPISHLELDLPAPGFGGWKVFLAEHDIAIVEDDLGRPSIARSDARQLFTEHREAEQRQREAIARRDVELEKLRQSRLRPGIPADRIPAGIAPAVFITQSDRDERPRRRSFLEDALDGGEMTVHRIRQAAFEDE
jgi:hypothetical protein